MNDAQFWKHELFRERARIRERIEEEGAERLGSHSVLIERFVFVTAYMMRKLTEAVALAEEVTTSRWPVSEFPCMRPPPHRTWFRISADGKTWRQPLEAHYDFNGARSRELPFRRLCHYLIHHFAFGVRLRPATGDLEILFNSDRSKDRLFGMRLNDYVAMDLVRGHFFHPRRSSPTCASAGSIWTAPRAG